MAAGSKAVYFVCLFVVVFGNFDVSFSDEDKHTNLKKKLQIGVKKRIDNCQVKSKKGDFLHMHYTVSRNIFQML
jgi:hypothetical protein